MKRTYFDIITNIEKLEEKVKKLERTQDPFIQRGDWNLSGIPLKALKNKNENYKTVVKREERKGILFPIPYSEIPTVFIGISSFNADSTKHNIAVNIITKSVTETGFSIIVKTDNASKVGHIRVEWLAFGKRME
ncbi:MAG: H-type lectin domain-containing protein [Spirochaetes bacterium]|nr:H-type lectin domain-containing protein [Spirochaetota bacterium]